MKLPNNLYEDLMKCEIRKMLENMSSSLLFAARARVKTFGQTMQPLPAS